MGTVISDGPIAGTLWRANAQDTESGDDSDSDSDSGDEEEEKEKSKVTVTEKSDCCVVHIPPHTAPFDNSYSIHMIQLDHYSCTVPQPLCLTFFWMQCGEDTEHALRAMDGCFDLFYRTKLIVDENEEKRPLGLMKTVYEQR